MAIADVAVTRGSSYCQRLLQRTGSLAVVGLGYVGLPIAVAFSRKVNVIGFDCNEKKIDDYNRGMDPTQEVGAEQIRACSVEFTADAKRLAEAEFVIVAVPTPVSSDRRPDLGPVRSACKVVGQNLRRGAIVVFESTVYPGVTEDICVPILETESGLICGSDFAVGYSPERINPGDSEHRLANIVKIVSGMDQNTLDEVAEVYNLVIDVGVFRAQSIKVAEAAKVIENAQRDINIAFMNELSLIFDRMSIDTQEVLRAAGTKWNFLKFTPGLVGGHCIGVDPYYLTYRAEQLGYKSQIVLAGREINDSMGAYIAHKVIKKMIANGVQIKGAVVAVLGLTFKEGCPDTRNTKVVDIIDEFKDYGILPVVSDPLADPVDVFSHYEIQLCDMEAIRGVDAIVIATPHPEFKSLSTEALRKCYSDPGNVPIIFDVKGLLDRETMLSAGFDYGRL
ncbi:UDP-glucose 6-dehydrogenase tuaD [Actinomyces bovis]|uniref:UDP-glucose 6-dehydrogenase tuaD n=1 Tax=Actinomyces bovis TaxID=1658 RepID=A0ABY1VPM9_9ACTO|nr:nucleotide sugar dehydrogenase [Actinomyces bovis]SPT53753.1 UDP-glucose 6-dehydrogenase tuaD [Actinomyces bovis]VEG53078.1 UDP-glucose 6-dehydrogenase tuaD [Actinomyces israelii]